MEQTVKLTAKQYANHEHKKAGCTYGDSLPYVHHLEAVVTQGKKHIYYVIERKQEVLDACWCHDTIEDCGISYNDLKKIIGEFSADIVYDVTNELGKNRKEKALRTYPKIAANSYAIFVKLCDRFGNTAFSKSTGHRMFECYKNEYPEFRKALKQDELFHDMWVELDELNEYEG
jgi:(p)ppGpp synthase/HD superfamily hydrolase